MNRRLGTLSLALGVLLLATPVALHAQRAGVSRWHGQWTSPTGFLYIAELQLEIRPDGAAEAAITWTLAHSPRETELPKLGQKGVEYVRGRYDVASGVLALEGYRKEDPSGILGLDTYRILLAENGWALAGMTKNHGDWQGRFWATRVDRERS